jgi:hypothetical protein
MLNRVNSLLYSLYVVNALLYSLCIVNAVLYLYQEKLF